jgi:hypothetical protein
VPVPENGYDCARIGESDVTSDDPYTPTFENPEDAQEAMRASRAESHAPKHAPPIWQPPQGRSGHSLLPAVDAELDGLLHVAESKLDAGHPPVEEAREIMYRLAFRLARSRRPQAAASAMKVLGGESRDTGPHPKSITCARAPAGQPIRRRWASCGPGCALGQVARVPARTLQQLAADKLEGTWPYLRTPEKMRGRDRAL